MVGNFIGLPLDGYWRWHFERIQLLSIRGFGYEAHSNAFKRIETNRNALKSIETWTKKQRNKETKKRSLLSSRHQGLGKNT
jgi:hypothetical protein